MFQILMINSTKTIWKITLQRFYCKGMAINSNPRELHLNLFIYFIQENKSFIFKQEPENLVSLTTK